MAKIVIVEDDVTMLSLLSTLLQMEGFQVLATKEDELENVFTQIQHEKPALVLVDVNLRRFKGFDLLRKMRSAADLGDTRVVMSSGIDFSTQCLQEGADDFILKPYMPDDLIRMIRKALSAERS
jgi:DNA-binding response OmpR family regulator